MAKFDSSIALQMTWSLTHSPRHSLPQKSNTSLSNSGFAMIEGECWDDNHHGVIPRSPGMVSNSFVWAFYYSIVLYCVLLLIIYVHTHYFMFIPVSPNWDTYLLFIPQTLLSYECESEVRYFILTFISYLIEYSCSLYIYNCSMPLVYCLAFSSNVMFDNICFSICCFIMCTRIVLLKLRKVWIGN